MSTNCSGCLIGVNNEMASPSVGVVKRGPERRGVVTEASRHRVASSRLGTFSNVRHVRGRIMLGPTKPGRLEAQITVSLRTSFPSPTSIGT